MMVAEEKIILIFQQEYFPFCVLGIHLRVFYGSAISLLTGEKISSSGD